MPLTIPPREDFSDIEQQWIDLEPDGLLSNDQDSYWGQRRKIYADYLQTLVDDFEKWYLNIDPNTVESGDLSEWETMLGIPTGQARTDKARQAFILSRWQRGPFTRTRRQAVVQSFVEAVLTGTPIVFSPGGMDTQAAWQ